METKEEIAVIYEDQTDEENESNGVVSLIKLASEKAIEAHKQEIEIELEKKEEKAQMDKTVFVSNILYHYKDEDLLSYLQGELEKKGFSESDVKKCKLKKSKKKGSYSGFVLCTNTKVVNCLITLSNEDCLKPGGRKLFIKKAQNIPPNFASPSTESTCLHELKGLRLIVNGEGKTDICLLSENYSVGMRVRKSFRSSADIDLLWKNSLGQEFKVELNRNIISCKRNKRKAEEFLSIELKHIPFLFRSGGGLSSLFGGRLSFLFEGGLSLFEDWFRIPDFTLSKAFGRSVRYELVFNKASKREIIKTLTSREILHDNSYPLEINNDLQFPERQMSPEEAFSLALDKYPDRIHFKLQMALWCCISKHKMDPLGISRELLELLAKPKMETVLSVLHGLTNDIRIKRINVATIRKAIKSNKYRNFIYFDEISLKQNDNFPICHLDCTPTRLDVGTPTYDQSNRMLRSNIEHIHRFIRVRFCDENRERMLASESGKLFERVESVIQKGFELGGDLKFSYLGNSNSQLRQSSCWFYAEGKGAPTITALRESMGFFEEEKCVAKQVARVGQSFSDTRPTKIRLTDNQVIREEDVEYRNYCFSDGVGKMSFRIAEDIQKQLKLSFIPSAVQFRLRGAKGMLTLDPRLGLKNKVIVLRKSQIKYKAPQHNILEICDYPKQIPMFLNRPLILVLYDLGVPIKYFEVLLDLCLNSIKNATENNDIAKKLLQNYYSISEYFTSYNTASLHKNPNTPLSTSKVYMDMLNSGFSVKDEPFLEQGIHVARSFALRSIRTRLRIPVSKAVMLFGVMDEHEVLEEGEIFINLSIEEDKDEGNERVRIKKKLPAYGSEVLVGRNPVIHPGDIRLLTLVDKPALRHIKDCVVFPSKGRRPHPSEMGGGDLDGDIYFVIWEELLFPVSLDVRGHYSFPEIKFPFEPMDYSRPPPKKAEGLITIDHHKQHFLDFLKSDTVGQIATAHLITAEKANIFNGDSLLLAQLHSKAVDFNKTGVPAEIPSRIIRESKVFSEYPDYMEKHGKPSFKTTKASGKLWRTVAKLANDKPRKGYGMNKYFDIEREQFRIDKSLLVEGYEEYVEDAKHLHEDYFTRLISIMEEHDSWLEGEVLTGCVLKYAKSREKMNGMTVQNLQNTVRILKKEFRERFYEEFNNEGFKGKLIEECQKKASAWYYVT